MNPKRLLAARRKLLILSAVIIVGSGLLFWLFGNNAAGHYKVIQMWPRGNLKIVQSPGLYWKGPFCSVTGFRISDIVSFIETFAERKRDRVKVEEPINVVFKDNGEGEINGFVRYTLPSDEEKMRLIVNIARNEETLRKLIKANITTGLTLVASSYKSGESVRERGRFIREVFACLRHGAPAYSNKVVEGELVVTPVTDQDGSIRRESGFAEHFGIGITNFTLRKIVYDRQTQTKLDEHRLFEQQRDNAVLEAEKLRQETITAKAEEEKLIAEMRAREEHKKQEAEIRAEKVRNVARIEARQDLEVAQIKLERADVERLARIKTAEGEKEAALMEAKGRKALAQADNSLALRLQMKKETLTNVANALKDMRVPQTIIGKDGAGKAGNPMLDVFLMNQIKELQRDR